MKSLFNYLKLILVFIFISPVLNASETEVTWAGVAFMSDKDPNKLYPNLQNIGHANLNKWALKSLKSKGQVRKFNNFKIITDKNGNPKSLDINQTEGVLMSVVFFADDTFFGKDISALGSVSYDNSFQIYGALVFFEFGSGSYVNSMPLILDKTFGEMNKPNSETTLKRFTSMLNGDFEENFFDELFKRAQNLKINEIPEKFAKFSEVKFGKSVEDFFSKSNEVKAWKLRINKQFENVFSMNTQIPIVPSGPNTDVNTFSISFLNSSQKIDLPEPFFIFNANVVVFKKFVTPSKRNTFKTVCHFVGIRLTFKVKEDDGPDDEIMNIPFLRGKDSCGIIGIKNVADSDYYFPMNMLALISKSVKQFKSIDKTYLSKVVKGKKVEEAITEINKVKEEFKE